MNTTKLLKVLLAGAALALPLSSARADEPTWLDDISCQSAPVTATAGYKIKIYQYYLNRMRAKIEISSFNSTGTTPVATFEATHEPYSGNANEMVRIYDNENFRLETHLQLDLDNPTDEVAWFTYSPIGADHTALVCIPY